MASEGGVRIGELIAGPDPLVFSAEDGDGALVAIVPGVLWEQFRAEAPVWSDTEDQRDYALQMVELRLAERPVRTVSGLRVAQLEVEGGSVESYVKALKESVQDR